MDRANKRTKTISFPRRRARRKPEPSTGNCDVRRWMIVFSEFSFLTISPSFSLFLTFQTGSILDTLLLKKKKLLILERIIEHGGYQSIVEALVDVYKL